MSNSLSLDPCSFLHQSKGASESWILNCQQFKINSSVGPYFLKAENTVFNISLTCLAGFLGKGLHILSGRTEYFQQHDFRRACKCFLFPAKENENG